MLGGGRAARVAYPEVVPLPVRLVLGALLVLAGGALLVIALLGARERLPRNRYAGVRTAATLSSDAAFVRANRVAAPLCAAAGVVGTAGGAVVLAGGPLAVTVVVLALTAVGVLVLAGLGGALGDRAAAAVGPAPSACTGSCAGCDLVEGCTPSDATTGPGGPAGP